MSNVSRHLNSLEPKPRIVLSNSGDMISRPEFYEIEWARFGSFDGKTEKFSISWTLGPLKVRYGNSRTFRILEQRPVLCFPGHSELGEWEGTERSLLLCFPSGVIENVLHCSPADLEKIAPAEESLTKIEHYMQLIRADVAASSPAGPTVMEALTSGLLDAIFPDDDRCQRLLRTGDRKRFRTMVDYMDVNLRQDLRLEEIAREAGMSVRHMTRIFKASTSLAPHEYILRMRVTRATELIRLGKLELCDIASAVGFSSHAHMTAAFRRTLGRTPSQFRNT